MLTERCALTLGRSDRVLPSAERRKLSENKYKWIGLCGTVSGPCALQIGENKPFVHHSNLKNGFTDWTKREAIGKGKIRTGLKKWFHFLLSLLCVSMGFHYHHFLRGPKPSHQWWWVFKFQSRRSSLRVVATSHTITCGQTLRSSQGSGHLHPTLSKQHLFQQEHLRPIKRRCA